MANDKKVFAGVVLVSIVAIVGLLGLSGFGNSPLTGAGVAAPDLASGVEYNSLLAFAVVLLFIGLAYAYFNRK